MEPLVLFADPKMDLPFKKLFGTLEHKGLLIELLNALLRLPDERRIVDLEYLSGEQLPAHDGLKLSILDVKCTDATGTRYVVEMQVFPVDGFEKRVVLNACKAYVEQLESGSNYSDLSDVIAVTICNFALWPREVPLLSRWHLREQESGHEGLGQIQYVFLELPKLGRELPRTLVEKWAYLFREAERLHEVPEELRDAPFAEALDVLRRNNFDEREWTAYQREKIAEQDFRGGLTHAEKRGEARGEARGEQRGLEAGERLGRVATLRANLLQVLATRGLAVSDEQRERIGACDDPELLSRWFQQALTAHRVEELTSAPSA